MLACSSLAGLRVCMGRGDLDTQHASVPALPSSVTVTVQADDCFK